MQQSEENKDISALDIDNFSEILNTQVNTIDLLIGELHIGVYIFNSQGEFLYSNIIIQTLTGYSEQELKKMKFFDLVYTDDKDFVRERGFSKIKDGNGAVSYDFRLISKTETIIYVRIAANRIFIDNQPVVIGFAFDITDQKQTKEELEQSRTNLMEETVFLTELIVASPEAIVVTDKNDIVNRINPAFTELYGYTLDEVQGKNLNQLITKNQEFVQATDISKEIIKGNKVNLESIRYRKDGTPVLVSILGAPVYINNEIVAVYGIYRDISERVNTQNELLQSQKELSLLMKNMPGMIYKCLNDEFWTMKYVSSGCKLLTDYESSDLINNNNISYKTIIKKEDITVVRSTIDDAIINHTPWEVTYRIRTKNNTTKWVREVGHCVANEAGDVQYLEGFISDYTAEYKAFEYKKTLFKISDATIQTTSPQQLYNRIHTLLADIIDTKNLVIALYIKETDNIRLAYIADEKDSFNEFPAGKTLTGYLIHSGKSLLTNEESISQLYEEGKIDMVGSPCESWLGVPLKIEDETIGAIVVQSYDKNSIYTDEDQQLLEFVSEHLALAIQRINYEDNILKQKEKAEESDKLKSSFLANMSHEIRSPMNAILGFTELLRDSDPEPESAKEYMNIVINRSKDLMGLIDEIIDLSKMDAGIFKLNESNIFVNDLLHELHAFYQIEKKKREKTELDIRISLPANTDNLQIFTDVSRINQVINNMVLNAMKFTHNGHIEIGYSIQDDQLLFYIEDTGIGIPYDKQAVIFERFRQVDESHTREYQGTGLGLSIAKTILEKMNGKIWVKSTPGLGSTFYFTLPISSSNTAVVENKKSTIVSEQKNISHKWDDKLILVAEDDHTNYRYLETLLRLKKVKSIVAEDGQKAVDIVRKNKGISLILMDVRMPNMDGLEATRQIRSEGYTMPIIAQTANAMSDDRELANDAGCDDYLPKPIKKDQLYKLLEKYL